MALSLGLVGLGSFGRSFADLFKSHPLVDRIALCDLEADRIQPYLERADWQDKLSPRDVFTSLDDLCRSDVDAIVLITQPWLHAPQAVRVLESGKHVYSAVPILNVPDGDEILEWCDRLVETCRHTGRHYMLGETTYYRPEAMFCRRMAADGVFGDFVYAEGEYFHDVDSWCNLREVYQMRSTGKAGEEWHERKQSYIDRGILDGPMHYPTHSTCGPVCVMEAHATRVTAYGYANANEDPFFANAAFSNEVALFQMSNGASVRIVEAREVGEAFHEHETFRIVGTRGVYNERRWKTNGRTTPDSGKPPEIRDLTVDEMRDPLPPEVAAAFARGHQGKDFYGGHGGSHAYLAHEFVDAIAHDRHPAINIWEAARYMAMGVMAHKSALKEGETLAVPDWGDAPA